MRTPLAIVADVLNYVGYGNRTLQDAMQILSKVAQTYRGLKSYHFEGATVAETNSVGGKSTSETGFVIAYMAPYKSRVEFRYPSAGNWIRVSDGRILSCYRSIRKELVMRFRVPCKEPMFQTELRNRIHDEHNP
jgi:hypothetical protein